MSAPKVSLLGLGRMGEPIARRLLTALGDLTVWNRTSAKAAASSRLAHGWPQPPPRPPPRSP